MHCFLKVHILFAYILAHEKTRFLVSSGFEVLYPLTGNKASVGIRNRA
jgi:hypothetical protein